MYIVARPVSGAEFYGRKALLERLYQSTEWGTWIIGGRRMGKTSTLHQIRHYALSDPQKIALFCNWQPARDIPGLRDALVTSIQDSESQVLASLGISKEAVKDLTFRGVLDQIVKRAREQDMRVFLLVDEPEDILRKLAATNQHLLKELRASLLQEALHTVIVSGPRLRELWELPWATSPFWEGFDTHCIGRIEWEEAANLVRQTQSDKPLVVSDALVHSILEGTGQIPWLIQSICDKLDDYNSPITEKLQVPDTVWSTHDYDDRFKTEYKTLSQSERCVLRSIGGLRGPSNVNKTAQECNLSEAEVLKILSLFDELGYAKQDALGSYEISNHFLNEWLAQGLWQSCEDKIEKQLAAGMAGSMKYYTTKVALDPLYRHLAVEEQQVAIAEEFERISGLGPQTRGQAFQKLFASIVEQHGWSQEEGVRTSHEEMDLMIHRGRDYYLIECKWKRDPVQARVIRELRGKLGNRADVCGGVVSMSGFTRGAVEQVEDYTGDRPILLFGLEDMQSMVYRNVAFDDLLDEKYQALITRRKALFS